MRHSARKEVKNRAMNYLLPYFCGELFNTEFPKRPYSSNTLLAPLEDSLETRHQFLSVYTSSVWSLQMYFHSLPEPDRVLYAPWNLPPLPTGMRRQVGREQELQE